VANGDVRARALAAAARRVIGGGERGNGSGRERWRWPEPALTYANAVLPHALIAVGAALDDQRAECDGLDLLDWLEERCTAARGHLSVTPVGGWTETQARPGFDQQPIEVVSLAEAAAHAYVVSANEQWLSLLKRCLDWFRGFNDGDVMMVDLATGGGYDGLTPNGPNLDQGGESTLAWLATLQLAHRLLPASNDSSSAASSTTAAPT
jgi:hypothetical protein